MFSTMRSDRLEIITVPPRSRWATFGEDVAAGLTAARKHLWSKYFYDDVGSALFDAITHLPEYYPTRAETEILVEQGWEIVRALEEPVEFLELGSGSAAKTRILIEEGLRAHGSLRYTPIDISSDALCASARALVAAYPALRVRGFIADYFDVLASPELTFERRALAMLMGSNLGNYAPDRAHALLTGMHRALRSGDGLLIGVDGESDRATLERAYDDPLGVTAAFDRNVLARINRELGGTFDVTTFTHVVSYDERRRCVDSFLESNRAQTVRIEGIGLAVAFAAGERIHTESSYKFDRKAIVALGTAAGFTIKQSWLDAANRFGVHLFIKK
ncbi:MAG TPA: L-histidine N(alpha)-methyltransferase [Candidatus Baltobacteraceae bacterium]